MIKAPFNFVPLPDKVVFPEWASMISHDVPFSDGISGSIKISLTALTPIFVRNGHSRSDKEASGDTFDTFSRIGDRFFLPGTTVKGAVRNNLEILSFGKMRLDRGARFAQREWDNTSLYPMMEEQGKVRCGWLRMKEDGGCVITDCGAPLRISHDRIDEYFKCRVFKEEFSQESRFNLKDEREIGGEMVDPKTACYKYKLIERIGSLEKLKDITFSQDEKRITKRNESRMKVDSDGDVSGTIVLTGQPDQWMVERPKHMDPTAGKYYEFVFRTPSKNAKRYDLTEEEFNQYKFIYADSPDWKYANERLLPSTGIPVFFRLDNGSILDWGLAFLYKLPYRNTPYETLPDDHHSERHDMAECIFGYAGKESSLKGRVQFSHFMSDKASLDPRRYRLVLNGPKASYYPIYIDQQGRGNNGVITSSYRTYNDGVINGWKRYLHRGSTWEHNSGSDSVDTYIRPIQAGAVFKGTVRFHNLRPEELGALLSAITFHGNEATCRHQIGMAKPYGYGKLKVDVDGVIFHSVGAVDDGMLSDKTGYMAVFEKYMTDHIGVKWTMTPTVKEMLTISRFDVPNGNDFTYMVLEMNGVNEFSDAKGGRRQQGTKRYLQKYSEIIGRSVVPDSLADGSESSINRVAEQRKTHEEVMNRIKEERKKAEELRISEEKRKAEERLRELERLEEEQRQKERADAQAAKAAAGLACLEETKPGNKDAYLIKEFKIARNRIDSYLKAMGVERIPEDQLPILHAALLRFAASPTRDEKKQKAWSKRDSAIWKYLEQKVSGEFADSLFAEVNP